MIFETQLFINYTPAFFKALNSNKILDPKLSSITRNAGAHKDLCTPKSEIDLSFQVSKREIIKTVKKQPIIRQRRRRNKAI